MKIHKIVIDEKPVFISQRENSFKVVKPWKNEDGSINWFNFFTGGSWRNLMLVAFVIVIILGLLNEYSNNIKILQEQAQNCIIKIMP